MLFSRRLNLQTSPLHGILYGKTAEPDDETTFPVLRIADNRSTYDVARNML